MLKFGIIEKINTPYVRVKFQDADGINSNWLPVIMPFAFEDKAFWMLSIGTQVACLMDEDLEEGCVIGAIYSESDPAPVNDVNKFHIEFKDGTKIEYDKTSHTLNAAVNGIANITALEISLNTPLVKIPNGDIEVHGIKFLSHKHSGVQNGSGITGVAQ